MGRERNAKGQFLPGNEIGSETRIKKGERLTEKYEDWYADDILDFFETYEGYPTFTKWCKKRSIHINTAKNWAKNKTLYPLFVKAYEQCKEMACDALVENGLAGRYNPQITKLLLSSVYGMSEKTEQDNNVTIAVRVADGIDEDSE